MKLKSVSYVMCAMLLLIATTLEASSQESRAEKLKDVIEESTKAAEALRQIMGAPDKAIPRQVLDSAECVAVFPSTIKGGFIVGAQKGDGVVSCRTSNGWSAPVFLDLAGGSIGAQIGAQSTDYILLFMNRSGIDHLLKNELTLGGEASVAAGPVGREAGASTDWKLNSQILSYSRSKGLFAGAELKGVRISIDNSDVRDVYGEHAGAVEVLKRQGPAPREVSAFPNELARYPAEKGK